MYSKVICFFVLLLTLFCSKTINAQQLSSEEKNKIKKQLKFYLKNPGVYKKEQDHLTSELAAQTKTLVYLKERAENAEATLKKLKEENQRLADDNEIKTQIIADFNKRVNAASSYCQSGEFKVQIGKFDKFSLSTYLRRGKCINYELQNGFSVYTIDGFTDAKEAFNMAQQLRRMGMKGAFVTRFVNNRRVQYDHLLETNDKPLYDIKEDEEVSTSPIVAPKSPKQKNMPSTGQKKETLSAPAQLKNNSKKAIASTTIKNTPTPVNKSYRPEDAKDVELNEPKNQEEVETEEEELESDIEIKESVAPAKKDGAVNILSPNSKPKEEDNLEDYEEVKEIPENI